MSGILVDDHYKSGGTTSGAGGLNLNDIAGTTEIELLDLGNHSRRGSFSRPSNTNNAGRTGSDSKDRHN